MLTPRLHTVQWLSPEGLHNLAYREWGDPDNPNVLLCVHGLTRCGGDYQTIAEKLSHQYRVVAPDMPGRGKSDWLPHGAMYVIPFYVTACVALIARLNPTTLHWLGTSMGGLIGMGYASLPGNQVSKLILNDVGPTLNVEALQRIKTYVGQDIQFENRDQARAFIRAVSEPFGPHTEAQWNYLADIVLVEKGDKLVTHYDKKIADAFQDLSTPTIQNNEAALWAAYDAIKAPTLVVRGEFSDLLSTETLAEMASRGPKAKTVTVSGVGHAPTFMNDEQVELVRAFLN